MFFKLRCAFDTSNEAIYYAKKFEDYNAHSNLFVVEYDANLESGCEAIENIKKGINCYNVLYRSD